MGTEESMNHGESTVAKSECQVWKRRKLMERYLVIVFLLLFLVLLVTVGLLIHLVYSHNRPTVPVCLTSFCRNEAGRIISYMDLSADPCEDFYEFSCGSFVESLTERNIVRRISQDDFIEERMMKLVKGLLEASDKEGDPEFVKKVKKFYRSCVDSDPGTSEIMEAVLQRTKLRWPFKKDGEEDLEQTFATIMIYGNSNPFFGIDRQRNVLSIYGFIWTIIDPEVFLNTTEEKYYRKKEGFRKLLEYAMYKAKTPSGHIAEEAENIIELSTMLAKVFKNHFKDGYDREGVNATKSELLKECERIDFAQAIGHIYDYYGKYDNFTDDTPLKLYNVDYLRDMCEVLNKVDKKTLYSYMVWYLLSNKLKEMDPYFRTKFSDTSGDDYRPPPAKWKGCIQTMLYTVYEPGMSYLALKQLKPDEIVEEVQDYVVVMKKQLEEMFSSESWMDEENREDSISQMWNISADIGYSTIYLDEETLDKHFVEVNISDDYIENDLNLNVLDTRFSFFEQETPLDNETIIHSPLMAYGYFTGERFVLSLGLLSPPYFVPNGPKFTNYAITGFVIGHEIIHGFERMDSEYSQANGTSNWTNKTIEGFLERKRCFEEQYSNFPLGDNKTTINGTFTFHENAADYGGLIQAFKAYEKDLKANGEEPQLPGLPYSNQQMYFLSYSQQWCEYVKSEIDAYKYDSHSPGKYRVIGPLQNSPQFSEAFQCPEGSRMNPSHKCRLFG